MHPQWVENWVASAAAENLNAVAAAVTRLQLQRTSYSFYGFWVTDCNIFVCLFPTPFGRAETFKWMVRGNVAPSDEF